MRLLVWVSLDDFRSGRHWNAANPLKLAVLLATDGIADDLDSFRLGEFIHFVRSTYCPLAPAVRWRRLAYDLRNWPTPYHSDDKTLAFLWNNPTEIKTHDRLPERCS